MNTLYPNMEGILGDLYVPSISSIIDEVIRDLEIKKNYEGLTGVPSGFVALDRLTAGWQPSEFTILASRPAMGKTSFILSALRNAAVDHGQPVAIFSLEMTSQQVVNRLIAIEAEIDSEKIRKGQLAPHEWQQLHHKIQRLSEAPLFIDDTTDLSIESLRNKCMQLIEQYGVQVVAIDYLQLMLPTDSKVSNGEYDELSKLTRALKKLSKELNISIIALSQLSRAVETRGGDKKPQLADLRGSGTLEDDADMVMFLYRPEYYNITQDEAGNSTLGVGEVIIAKNRSGSLDTIQLRFINRFTKFCDLDGYFILMPWAIAPSGSVSPLPPTPGTLRHRANDLSNFGNADPNQESPF